MNLMALGAVLAMALGQAPPAGAPPAGFAQTFVEAHGPDGPLKGTLLAPAGGRGYPVMLIIPGSGPTDRDGDSPLGIKAAPYRLLAEALAQRGVATVRIDKRGMFASAAAAPDANAVVMSDYVDDTRSWVASIRRTTGVSCVWLLGHSEGGAVALDAADAMTDICGVIAVSTPGRPTGEVLRAQLHANPANAPLSPQADAAISELEAGRRVDVSRLPPALQQLFRPAVQGFEISEFKLDPAALARRLNAPLLIVQGDADLQVGVDDARRLQAADPKAQLAILPGVNHVLKTASVENRRANVATYADPGLPLAPAVAPAIAGFIASHR